MRFKHYHRLALALWLLAAATVCSTGQAQETAFTYQGRLNDGGNPANGSYDFQFVLYDSSTNGNPQGPVLSKAATAVSNGLFTVSLDFGNQFPGANRWLEVSVCTNASGNFITLSPRQPISATPYAITAANVLAGGIPAGVYTNAVIFSNPGNQFAGNGSGLTNISFNSLSAAAQAQLTNVANGAVAAVLTNVTFLYPNDTNDQTATIQAAFSKTDSVVWFTPGNYYATNLWLTSNIVVYGNGAHLNQLKTPAQNGYNNYFPDFNMGALINCNSNNVNQRIYDLILDGMSPNNYNDMTWNIWNGVNIGSVPFQGADSFSPTPCGNHNGLIINQAAGGEVRGCTAQNFDSAGFVIFSSVDQGSYQAPHLIFSGNTALTNFEGFYCQTWSEWSTYGSADYNMMDGLAANHCAVGIEDTSGNGMIFNSTFNDCFIGLNLGGGSGNGAAGGNTPTHGHVANVNLNHDYCGLVLYGQPTGEHFDGVIEMATTTNIFCGSGGNIRFNSCLLLNVFADSCTFEVANGTIYNFVVTNSYVNFVNNNTLVAFTNGVPGSDFTNVVCTSLGQSVIRHSLNRVWTNSLAGDGYEGDGSRITGLDAANLNGTLPVASLPGVTTNVSTAGITFYITNGLVMRVTTP
jgi:hypothetical protein